MAICAAKNNKLEIFEESLIKYRIHDSNQTGILGGINKKRDYYEKRIKLVLKRCEILVRRFGKTDSINQFKKYAESRMNYYEKQNFENFYKLFKLRKFNNSTTYFELILPFLPECIFKFIITQIKKGRI